MIYEYRCTNCGKIHEEQRCVAERDADWLWPCECGCASHKRVMSATPGVVKNPAAGESR